MVGQQWGHAEGRTITDTAGTPLIITDTTTPLITVIIEGTIHLTTIVILLTTMVITEDTVGIDIGPMEAWGSRSTISGSRAPVRSPRDSITPSSISVIEDSDI